MRNFIITLLTCSVTMSSLALIYMAVMPFLAKRYSERGRYYAWLIIVIGLIIPFRPQFTNAIVKVDMQGEAAVPVVQIGTGTPVTIPMPMPAENTALPSAIQSISWQQIAVAVWLIGMFVFLIYHVVKHYRFVKMTMRWSENAEDEQLLSIFQSLKTEMGIKKDISLYLCSSIGSPMMIGFVKPLILMPKTDLAHDELRFILRHELIHYKRKDLYYKCLVLIATAIHWFNPIVYLMAKTIDALCEMSCDAEIVRSADADTRQYYTETIIGVIKYQSKLKTALSTNFYGGKKGMKKRIFLIMDMGKKKTGAVILCCAFVLTLATGMAFAANTKEQSNVTSYNPNNIALSTNEQASSTAVASNSGASELTEKDIARGYEIYAPFGLVYRGGELFYNGKPVRIFEDWYSVGEGMYAGRSYFDDGGTVDVYAVRDFSQIVHNADGSYDPSGILTGVKALSQVEFDARDLSEYNTESATPVAEYIWENMQVVPLPYERLGVSFDEKAEMMMYQGLPVREIYDDKTGTVVSLTAGTGFMNGVIPENAIDLTAVYDGDALTGLRKSTQEEFDARTSERLNSISETISSETQLEATPQSVTVEGVSDNINGRTFAEIFEDYVAYGIEFDTESINGGLGNIYYNGTLVKRFVDLHRDGGVLSCSSSDGGEITVRTVYDENDSLTGVEIVED